MLEWRIRRIPYHQTMQTKQQVYEGSVYRRYFGAKDFVGLEEVTKVEFLVMLFAETLGTFLLVLIGCASCITWTVENPPTVVHIAFTFGLAVASLAHVSHVTYT
ncbi:Aquaporin AQPAe.a [Eufriesea mexicana]|uniref:Aquaporin AQPAe.a n=1 Tax=Eufriesea mexicana TaxID=516756 RepID=A0A310SXJ9_9HYME|nr:Aquaporin AQPAe.a [Eufriesea mexicana]